MRTLLELKRRCGASKRAKEITSKEAMSFFETKQFDKVNLIWY